MRFENLLKVSSLLILAVLPFTANADVADVRRGDTVVTTTRGYDGHVGTAAAVFGNGSVSVQTKDCCGNYRLTTYPGNEVASCRGDACRGGICPGNRVVTASGTWGTAAGITSDLRVIIETPDCCGNYDYSVFPIGEVGISQ